MKSFKYKDHTIIYSNKSVQVIDDKDNWILLEADSFADAKAFVDMKCWQCEKDLLLNSFTDG